MIITCKNCGGDVNILSNSGGIATVKCTCCGSVYEHELEAKQSTKSSRPGVSNEMAGEDIYDRNIRSVVEIYTEAGSASGYLISSGGVIMTNTHAVTKNEGAPCTNITVKINNASYKAQIIALGDDRGGDGNGIDLALLIAKGGPFEHVNLGSSASVRNGEAVYYIGNSKGEGTCITGGIVSDRDRISGNKHYIMTDAATNPGNSGGPLINKNGEVIGTHVSARTGAVGMKYAIPIDAGKEFIVAVAQKAGLPVAALCDTSIKQGKEFSAILSGIKLIVEGIMFIKDLIANRKIKA